jgi:hypothetical protein
VPNPGLSTDGIRHLSAGDLHSMRLTARLELIEAIIFV